MRDLNPVLIGYRLVWLEELLTSKAMNPLKVLGKTGVLTGFTQKFDEGVELLDDLNDHVWNRQHLSTMRNFDNDSGQPSTTNRSVTTLYTGSSRSRMTSQSGSLCSVGMST